MRQGGVTSKAYLRHFYKIQSHLLGLMAQHEGS